MQRINFLTLLFLCSCRVSMPQDVAQENILPPPCLEKSRTQSISTGYFTDGNWPEKCWWHVFNSEELNSLIATALVQNPTIHQIQARIVQAQKEAVITRSSLFPSLFFNIEESSEHLSKYGLYKALNPNIPLNVNLIDVTFNFAYEFDFWGKNANHFLESLGHTLATIAEEAEAELIISVAIAQAYFTLQTNWIKQQLHYRKWLILKEVCNLEQMRQKKSLNSTLPQLQIEEKVLQAHQEYIAISAEIAQNQHLLNILLGVGPDNTLCLTKEIACFPDTLSIPTTLSLDLIGRRPDLRAQIWEVEAQSHAVGAAIANFYPNINIAAFLGLESVLFSRLFRPQSATWGVEPALHLPIFTAGAIRANVEAQKALFDAAVFTYNALVLRSAQEVADLLTLMTAVFEKKELQEGIVEQARTRFCLTKQRQEKGLDSLLAVYSVEIEWIERELKNIDLLNAKYSTSIKLIQALGGGYNE